MSRSKVQVTFSAPLIFLSSDQWTQIRTAIAAQFPLQDLTWKSSSRPATRTIPELDVELIGLDTIREEQSSQIPQTLLDKPFMNIYIVTCDDTDIYKNTVRKQIKDWHSTVSQRKNQDWLILLVVRPDARAASSNFFAIKSSVLDRIKADFNSDKRDRCVQVIWSQGAITPAACTDLTTKMKDGIMSAFDSAVAQRSEEVKRSENQRQMPGWNFCTFFILKESLASSFVGMSLVDDATLTYSELEASFLHTQTSSLSGQRNISWFGKPINPDRNDDSLPLLDIQKKPYRDLILNNTISVFDFRVYLLAKHCDVLGMSGRVSELARKSASFLGGFGQRLKACDVPLPEFFVESWIYASALSVVSECNKWAELFELDTLTVSSFSAAKGELLELARMQLDKVGIRVGHLPRSIPFSMSLSSTSDISEPTTPTSPIESSADKITNKDLLAALADREAFDKLYIETTNRAIDMYIKGGRRKFALKLHGDLAALHLNRARNTDAQQIYNSLPAHYIPHSWTSLATFMHARRLETHAQLGNPHNVEWVETALAFLKGIVEEEMSTDIMILGKDETREYISGLVKAIRDCTRQMDNDIVASEHPMIFVAVKSELAMLAEDEDGSYLDVIVRNELPCDVISDTVRMHLTGAESTRLEYSTSGKTLPPGPSTLRLFCPNPAFGLFMPDTSEVLMADLTLRWNHQLQPSKVSRKAKQVLPLIRLPRDLAAVNITVEPPRSIQLDAPQSVSLTLYSGRNSISQGSIKLPSSMGVDFLCQDAEVILHVIVECVEDCIKFSGMEKESQIRIRIPHTYHAAAEPLRIVAELEYTTPRPESSSYQVRHARFVRFITTSLPLLIQAHDHFRGTSVISKFTISTSPGTYQHLRILSVQLETIDDEQGSLVVTGCRSEKLGVLTVTPVQPAHFLFRIESKEPRKARASMHLHIEYCLLREEIENLVSTHIAMALKELSEPHYISDLVKEHILKALENDATWVERYNITRELRVLSSALPELSNTAENTRVTKVVKMVIETLRTKQLAGSRDLWRKVAVPVDLPFKNIVSTARVRLNARNSTHSATDAPIPLYAGQPIPATMTINNSFHWCGPGSMINSDEKNYTMRFDVKEMPKDWLIGGRKRGDFVVTDGSVHSVPLTLIPLHHGELRLPQVNVYPLPLTSGEMTMGSMALPSAEVYQAHGAECVLILPPGGRTTFVVAMGGE
ncbi:trafficking protein particle complex subunit 10 [Hysterangium stoloniferum]|nr:trafficking protein particle complex subunit 10 [Hysterangium stoloniferum]